MSDAAYLQYVPSASVPPLDGSAPVLFPVYFWQGMIFLPESPMMVIFFRETLSP